MSGILASWHPAQISGGIRIDILMGAGPSDEVSCSLAS
jgi:hypothetical protein